MTPSRAFASWLARFLCFAPALLLFAAGCGGGKDLSTEQLAQVVRERQPALKKCYDEALVKHPYKREMRFDAIIEIAPSGRVEEVEFEGGSGLPGMGGCLEAAIKSWKFPKAGAATHTRLPLIFKPEVVQSNPGVESFQQALQEALGPAQ